MKEVIHILVFFKSAHFLQFNITQIIHDALIISNSDLLKFSCNPLRFQRYERFHFYIFNMCDNSVMAYIITNFRFLHFKKFYKEKY
jgi:hypothetical protein